MCIYCGTHKYRKIYEHHHGAIPKDDQGRSYHIHHIDGNHNNNDPNNLIAVTLQEHYDIHKSQGDWGACVMLAMKFKVSPEETSYAARQSALKRLQDGTHHFIDPEWRKKYIESDLYHERRSAGAKRAQRKRTAEGRNPFTGGFIQRESNRRRVEDGTHHLLCGDNSRAVQKRLVQLGKHHFQSDNHPGVKAQKERLQQGTHHLQNNNPNSVIVQCPHCSKMGGAVNMKRYHFDKCKLKAD
jgi:hypothetical protein